MRKVRYTIAIVDENGNILSELFKRMRYPDQGWDR